MLEHSYIEISGGRLATLQHNGTEGQPTIIALHGWQDNAASFVPLVQALPDYNWLAIDFAGHGHSFHRAHNSYYHFIDWVSDIVEAIEALDLSQPPVIIGHSLGGMVATVLAGLFPDLLSKLILIDAAGLVIQDDENVISAMRDAMLSRSRLRNKRNRIHVDLESAIQARVNAGPISYHGARLLVERNTEQTEEGFRWRTDLRLKAGSPVRINLPAAEQLISEITVPTLIMLAENGYESMARAYSHFRPFYANHRCVTVSGQHHCHLDDPAESAQQIAKFLL